jgi:hypothetical protein
MSECKISIIIKLSMATSPTGTSIASRAARESLSDPSITHRNTEVSNSALIGRETRLIQRQSLAGRSPGSSSLGRAPDPEFVCLYSSRPALLSRPDPPTGYDYFFSTASSFHQAGKLGFCFMHVDLHVSILGESKGATSRLRWYTDLCTINRDQQPHQGIPQRQVHVVAPSWRKGTADRDCPGDQESAGVEVREEKSA